jgi:hypothetical protein
MCKKHVGLSYHKEHICVLILAKEELESWSTNKRYAEIDLYIFSQTDILTQNIGLHHMYTFPEDGGIMFLRNVSMYT